MNTWNAARSPTISLAAITPPRTTRCSALRIRAVAVDRVAELEAVLAVVGLGDERRRRAGGPLGRAEERLAALDVDGAGVEDEVLGQQRSQRVGAAAVAPGRRSTRGRGAAVSSVPIGLAGYARRRMPRRPGGRAILGAVTTPRTPERRRPPQEPVVRRARCSSRRWPRSCGSSRSPTRSTTAASSATGSCRARPDGLEGIAFAPFLHAGWDHLIGNTLPFLVLGAAIALGGAARVALVTVIVAVVGGLGTWLVAPGRHRPHRRERDRVRLRRATSSRAGSSAAASCRSALGLVVVAIWGTTLLNGLAPADGISWQGHLFGAVGGVVAAWFLDRRRRKPTPAPPDPFATSLSRGL